ncbi:dienelactone hydrolase family protein [Candidatus Rhodoluna planktonica]|uniref:Carboxymethylenebutenolidase n=1 Tax=Candidatus Rhodoluna planktonica TaxID=535712 RepID=A0A1D9DXK3_9MICO|nr:dienelactone hydrolase family protein [Candidatus Rhodoluna planktonica]AOY55533.1 carboxymethylenebutenolidase [Candidatus Rhodoluna planktonica]
MTSTTVELRDIQITPELKGVIATPPASAGLGPYPAVVMVHEVFGIDEAMRAQITRLAQAGYVVLMPDLFSRGGARKCLTATFKALTAGKGQAFDDVAAAKANLLARPDTTDKIGVIGFCMGGGFALLLANRGYDASAINYGMMPKDIDSVLEGACPIIGSFGAKDKQLVGAASKLEEALSERKIAHDIKEYPDAGHAFMNPHQAGGPFFGTLLRISGAKPNPEAAADAWARIEKFFGEHLR